MSVAFTAKPAAFDCKAYPGRLSGGLVVIGLFLDENKTTYTLKGKFCQTGSEWPTDNEAKILTTGISRSSVDISVTGTITVEEDGGPVNREATIKIPPILTLIVTPEKGVLYALNGVMAPPENSTLEAHRWGHEA